MSKLRVMAAMAAGAMGLLAPGLASAHFILMTPTNWAQEDASGLPEKSAPCGQADPATPAVATNAVTTFRPGQTITVMIQEAVPHPGWYKAVLSENGMSGLPADPMVTPGASACGTVTGNQITGLTPENPAVFPVLVDGALFHTGVLSGTQSFNVTLPSNVTCTNCVLQIVEFMSNHGLNVPGGCFYHHCANIAIQGAPADGGTSDASTGGTGGKTGTGGATGAAGATGTGAGGATAGVGGATGGGAGGSTSGGAGGSTSGGAGGATSSGTGGSTSGGAGGSTTGGAGSSGNSGSSSGGCSIASGAGYSASGLVGLLFAIFAIRMRRHRSGRSRG